MNHAALARRDGHVRELWNEGKRAGEIGETLGLSKDEVEKAVGRLRRKGAEMLSREERQAIWRTNPTAAQTRSKRDRVIRMWNQRVPIQTIAAATQLTPRGIEGIVRKAFLAGRRVEWRGFLVETVREPAEVRFEIHGCPAVIYADTETEAEQLRDGMLYGPPAPAKPRPRLVHETPIHERFPLRLRPSLTAYGDRR